MPQKAHHRPPPIRARKLHLSRRRRGVVADGGEGGCRARGGGGGEPGLEFLLECHCLSLLLEYDI